MHFKVRYLVNNDTLENSFINSALIATIVARGGGGLLSYKRLKGMCRLMGSHFHDWIDYNGVAFSIE